MLKFFINFSVFFLGSSIVWAHELNYIEKKQLADIIGITEVFPTLQSFYYKYADRLQTESLADAVEENYDFPAELISVTPVKLVESWQQKITDQSSRPYDFPLILELNLRAANIWQELLACQRGTNKAEKARAAYARGNNFCAGDADHDGPWKIKLQAFQRDVFSMIVTTKVSDRILHEGKEPQKFDNSAEYNAQSEITGPWHALFTQSVLNIFLHYYPFPKLTPYKSMEWDIGDDLKAVGLAFLDNTGWVQSKFVHVFGQQEYDMLQFEKYLIDMSYTTASVVQKPEIKSDEIRALIIHNVFFLLLHMPIGHCQQWGLWPALNGSSTFALTDNEFHTWGDTPRRYFPAGLLHVKHALSCGLSPVPLVANPKFENIFEGYLSYDGFNLLDEKPFLKQNLKVVEKLRQVGDLYLENN